MNFDSMLRKVLAEARALYIPVSDAIQPHVVLNTRAKKRYGCCRRRGTEYVIELSAHLQNAAERDVRAVLAHEVLHTCKGCMNHGPLWRVYAARFSVAHGYSISRTGEISGAEVPPEISKAQEAPYLVQCEDCGAQFQRMRCSKLVMHPERYRCRCGGTLRRIK